MLVKVISEQYLIWINMPSTKEKVTVHFKMKYLLILWTSSRAYPVRFLSFSILLACELISAKWFRCQSISCVSISESSINSVLSVTAPFSYTRTHPPTPTAFPPESQCSIMGEPMALRVRLLGFESGLCPFTSWGPWVIMSAVHYLPLRSNPSSRTLASFWGLPEQVSVKQLESYFVIHGDVEEIGLLIAASGSRCRFS